MTGYRAITDSDIFHKRAHREKTGELFCVFCTGFVQNILLHSYLQQAVYGVFLIFLLKTRHIIRVLTDFDNFLMKFYFKGFLLNLPIETAQNLEYII